MASEIVISNSRAKTWRRCPNQYRYKYIMELQPRTKKVQLERGSWIHDCLMYHYDGEDWREIHEKYVEKFNGQFEETREEWGDLPAEVERILRGYFKHYEAEDGSHHTIDSEMDEIIELPNGLKFRFIVDRIYEDAQGGLWLQDHKTMKKDFYDPEFMVLDAQLSRYFWCAEKLGYTPLRGIEYNQIKTKAPTIPQTLKNGQLSQRMNIDCDYWTYLATIKKHGLNPKKYMKILRHLRSREDRFFRRTQLPQDPVMTRTMMKELVETVQEIQAGVKRDRFPRTAGKNCKWDCDFMSLCTAELQGADTKSVIRHGYMPRNKED